MKIIQTTLKLKAPTLLLCLLMLTSLTACSSNTPSGVASSPELSAEDTQTPQNVPTTTDSYTTTTLEQFKSAASAYGTVQDMTETIGYDTAVVSTQDINIIYMLLKDEATAKSMALGDNDIEGTEVKTVSSGKNYDFYEEHATDNEEAEMTAFYGYYVRVENMLILITGSAGSEDSVHDQASQFFKTLGYTAA